MQPLCLVEVPGLTKNMVEQHAPRLKSLARQLGTIDADLPAVTMTGHASLLTGSTPAQHGVVGNGWFDRADNQVKFWSQSERLVDGESIWEAAKKRQPSLLALKHFWWPGMASTADVHTNVRPVYFADGRKAPDIYTNHSGLAARIQQKFGTFPMFNFWGPGVGIRSSEWIAETAIYLIDEFTPGFSCVYLPHLDYKQQTLGPEHPDIAAEVAQLDEVAADLLIQLKDRGIEVVLVSGYHMNQVSQPIEINRALRQAGWLKVIHNAAGELIDYGASQAFAVADHQLAHVYVRETQQVAEVAAMLTELPGVANVLGENGKRDCGLDHGRAGDLVVLADPQAWFVYYYWLDERLAPDFAKTIAIHDKPGYDPCEMLFDERLMFPKLAVATRLLKKMLGMRYTLDVISSNANRIRGSHGLKPGHPDEGPVWLSTNQFVDDAAVPLAMTDVKQFALATMFDQRT